MDGRSCPAYSPGSSSSLVAATAYPDGLTSILQSPTRNSGRVVARAALAYPKPPKPPGAPPSSPVECLKSRRFSRAMTLVSRSSVRRSCRCARHRRMAACRPSPGPWPVGPAGRPSGPTAGGTTGPSWSWRRDRLVIGPVQHPSGPVTRLSSPACSSPLPQRRKIQSGQSAADRGPVPGPRPGRPSRSGHGGPLALRPRGQARRLPRPGPPGVRVRHGRRKDG